MMASDFYQDGFDDGYGRGKYGEREYPETDGDRYSYERGVEDGRRRKSISEELDREGY
jgi:hypothetical protein